MAKKEPVKKEEHVREDGEEKISKHFKRKEFWCPCCHSVGNKPKKTEAVLKIADALRELYGKPIICSSGYRCAKHNKEVGGTKNSEHMNGAAMDLSMEGSFDRYFFARNARKLGAGGRGIYPTFVHIDVGESRTWNG